MYWSIQTSYDTQHLSNFYYDNHIYSFCCLPQGWVIACYVGASATELAYGQNAMLEFLKYKGWTTNSVELPWSEISQLLIIYMDDLCCFSQQENKTKKMIKLDEQTDMPRLFTDEEAKNTLITVVGGDSLETSSLSSLLENMKMTYKVVPLYI